MNISVIIPVYNAEKYITKAIESALQLEEVKEVILVEDGSPDNALDLCITFSEKHSRVKLYRHTNGENRGAGASRNLGIGKATQDYIAFLDADDFYLPNRFTKDKDVFQNNKDVDGVYNALGVYYYSDNAKEKFSKSFGIEKSKADNFLTTINSNTKPSPSNCFYGLVGLVNDYGYFHLDALTIKTAALKKIDRLFWESSMHEDTEFLIRLSYYCKLYPGDLYKAVALRGVHEENRITANIDKNKSRYLMYNELYKWYKEISIDKEILSSLLYKVKYFDFLVTNQKRSSFFCFMYTLKYPSIFFNDHQFGSFIILATSYKRFIPIIAKLKSYFVSIFFYKKKKKFNKS